MGEQGRVAAYDVSINLIGTSCVSISFRKTVENDLRKHLPEEYSKRKSKIKSFRSYATGVTCVPAALPTSKFFIQNR